MKYTIKIENYIGIAIDHHSTFDFKIICPATVFGSSLTKATSESNFYDVASPTAGKIDAPEIALLPGMCFTIIDYELVFKDKPAEDPSTFIKIAPDKLSFTIQTNDRIFVGLHEFTITALSSSNERLHGHDFSLTIYDSCNITQLVAESSALPKLTVSAMEPTPTRLSFKAFND